MTDKEKAEAMVRAYPELSGSLGQAIIVDTMTLLREERREVLTILKEAVDEKLKP